MDTDITDLEEKVASLNLTIFDLQLKIDDLQDELYTEDAKATSLHSMIERYLSDINYIVDNIKSCL